LQHPARGFPFVEPIQLAQLYRTGGGYDRGQRDCRYHKLCEFHYLFLLFYIKPPKIFWRQEETNNPKELCGLFYIFAALLPMQEHSRLLRRLEKRFVYLNADNPPTSPEV
jgi:hypothetical protein